MNPQIGRRTARFCLWLLPHLAALDPMAGACAAAYSEATATSGVTEPDQRQDLDRSGVAIRGPFQAAEASQ